MIAAVLRLADATPGVTSPATPDPDVPDLVTTGSWAPGLLSLVAFVFLAVAIWIIYRSMNRQLKKVDFPEAPGPAGTTGITEPDPGPPPA